MLTLPAALILEKNKLAAGGAWLELAELYLPGESTPALRLVNNTENLYAPGQNYLAWSNDFTEWSVTPGAFGPPTVTYGEESWDGEMTAAKAISNGQCWLYLAVQNLAANTPYRVALRMKTTATNNYMFLRSGATNKYTLLFSAFAATEDANGWRWLTGEYTPTVDLTSVTFQVGLVSSDYITTYLADAQLCLALPGPFAATAGTAAAGTLYQAFPFKRGEIEETGKGQQPLVKVEFGNVDGTVQAYMEANSGLRGATVRLMVVHSEHLDEAPIQDMTFEIMQSSVTGQWATLELGAAAPTSRRFPSHRLLKNHCRWKFKDAGCQYAGATATCNKTLSACRAMAGGSNAVHFGGFPGIGRGGIYA